jgi:hypothetical protein
VCVDKDRELSEAQAEIKALRHSERLREKAVEEVMSNFLLAFIGFWIVDYCYNLSISFFDCVLH